MLGNPDVSLPSVHVGPATHVGSGLHSPKRRVSEVAGVPQVRVVATELKYGRNPSGHLPAFGPSTATPVGQLMPKVTKSVQAPMMGGGTVITVTTTLLFALALVMLSVQVTW